MTLTKEDLQAIGQMMDSKLAAALEPIKVDINGLKEDVNGLKEDVNGLKEDVNGLKEDVNGLKQGLQVVRTSQLKVELEQYPRISAALDGVAGAIEKNTEQDRRIFVVENKVENHDNRIIALEYAAKAK